VFDRRYRSHHDSEYALKSFLNLSRPDMATKEELELTLNSIPEKDERVIYFHIPFCDKICTFCNLNRGLKKDDLEEYTDFLLKEIDKYSKYEYINSKEFNAVYFGGGTPTTLSEKQLEKILKAINEKFSLSKDVEFTFETTLHNLNPEKIEMMQELGVNRFSVGIQTFDTEGRRVLGRTYDYIETVKRLKKMREIFKGTLCIDIIYSYPGQTISNLELDAKTLMECGIDSVSFYSLMLHEGSILHNLVENGKIRFDRDIESDKRLHNYFYEKLLENEYEMLELSKLVKPGRDEYRYIKQKYLNGDVLPIGLGAGGRIGDIGVYNMAPARTMLANKNEDYDFFNKILGIMQFGVYDLGKIENMFSQAEYASFTEKFEQFVSTGYIKQVEGEEYRLDSDGVFWGNNIAIELLKSIIKMRKNINYEKTDFTRRSDGEKSLQKQGHR